MWLFLGAKVGEIGLAQEHYRVYLSQKPCDHEVRSARLEIGQALLTGLMENMSKIPSAQQKEAINFFNKTKSQVTLDGGLLMAVQGEALTEKISENLTGFIEAESSDQKEALKEAMPYIQQLMKMAQAVSQEASLAKTFPNGPEAKVKKLLRTLVKVTAKSEDSDIQNYHQAFALYYHSRFGGSGSGHRTLQKNYSERL